MVSLLKHFGLPWIGDIHARKETNGKGKSVTHFIFKDALRIKVKG